MDIVAWLDGLGLERYAQAFRDNDIDAELLADLSDADLTDIGVSSLGARRKILRAIHESTDTTTGRAADLGGAQRGPSVERRQLTVMFVDLVGSTGLSAKLDPEAMRDAIVGYQEAVGQIIAHYDGYVAQYLGDGLLSYFGWPRAQEDVAARAVRTALAATEAVAKLPPIDGQPLSARVGIATGLVLVGHVFGTGGARQASAIGETPNLAARLQGLARPGEVVIAETTRGLLGDDFEIEQRGTAELKGIDGQVPVLVVRAARAVASRFEARARKLLPMVGRQEELSQLQQLWHKACDGHGDTVLVEGEAGIGKSRLVRALADLVKGDDGRALFYQCSPYHRDTALWPVVQQLQLAANFVASEPEDSKLDKLARVIANDASEARDLIAELVGIEVPANGHSLSPRARRSRLLALLREEIRLLANSGPLLLVLEDAHWIDPTTDELISSILAQLRDLPVLLLITSRTDNRPTFAAAGESQRLSLSRLDRPTVEAMVGELGGAALSDDAIDALVARADGVPLFVEELTRGILDSAGDDVPTSLQDSLLARLDRIPRAKEIAQAAACVGRTFDIAQVAAATGWHRARIQSALQALIEAEIVLRDVSGKESALAFKHALVRDVAHASLMLKTKEQFHSNLCFYFRQVGDVPDERVAYHALQGGLVSDAIDAFLRAAERAHRQTAYIEAQRHYRSAIEHLRETTRDDQQQRRLLAALLSLGYVEMVVRGYGNAEIQPLFEEALGIAQSAGDQRGHIAAGYGLWSNQVARGNVYASLPLVDSLVTTARASGERELLMTSRRLRAVSLISAGRLREGCEEAEAAYALFQDIDEKELAFKFGHAPTAAMFPHWCLALWAQGFAEQAYAKAETAVERAIASGHANSFAFAIRHIAYLAYLMRDHPWLQTLRQRMDRFAEQHGNIWPFNVWVLETCSRTLDEDFAGAEPFLGRFIAYSSKQQTHLWLAYLLAEHGHLLARIGRSQEALDAVAQAEVVIRQGGTLFPLAETQRLAGLIHRSGRDDVDQFEASCLASLATAREQGAVAMELRTSLSLGSLWLERGERQRTSDLIAPVLEQISEGKDRADVRDAKRLLAQMQTS